MVKPPLLNHTGWYPVLIQAVVDSVYFFRDRCVGCPGSVLDARGFAKETATNGKILTTNSMNINGIDDQCTL